jgi:hypothetical protein
MKLLRDRKNVRVTTMSEFLFVLLSCVSHLFFSVGMGSDSLTDASATFALNDPQSTIPRKRKYRNEIIEPLEKRPRICDEPLEKRPRVCDV